jgi:hypothetical protein
MLGWRVERIEVVHRELGFGTIRNPIAQTDEDVDDLVDRASERMRWAHGRTRSRKSDVQTLRIPPPSELFRLEGPAPFLERGLQCRLDVVGQTSDRLAIGVRKSP